MAGMSRVERMRIMPTRTELEAPGTGRSATLRTARCAFGGRGSARVGRIGPRRSEPATA